MTDVPLVAGTAARAGGRDAARARAWVLLTLGGLLVAAALILVALVEAAEAPSAERSSAGHVLIRIASAAALLPVGALMLARVPAHPIGWLIAAAGLGKATANASDGYATYSHFVHTLPADEWIGWVGEWVGATIILIPATALLVFPDGRLPSRRRRAALWCGLAATALVALNGALSGGDNLTFQGNPLLSDETARAVGDAFLDGGTRVRVDLPLKALPTHP